MKKIVVQIGDIDENATWGMDGGEGGVYWKGDVEARCGKGKWWTRDGVLLLISYPLPS